MKSKIICMCGSTRFTDLMAALSLEFEKLGHVVLPMNYGSEWYLKNDGWEENSQDEKHSDLRQKLDELCHYKIDLCDEVFVCNCNNYIGESTAYEIFYAGASGKPIFYFENSLSIYPTSEASEKYAEISNRLKSWWLNQ